MVTSIVAIRMGVVALIVAWYIAMAEVGVDGVSTLICVCFLLLLLIRIEAAGVVTTVIAVRVGMIALIVAWYIAVAEMSVDGISTLI